MYHAMLGISIMTTLAIFIYASVEEKRSTVWHYSGEYTSDRWFSPESWVCQTKIAIYDYHYTCNLAVRVSRTAEQSVADSISRDPADSALFQ